MSIRISVVLPTHNPRADYLSATLEALRLQSLPLDEWELVLVDNRSEVPLAGRVDLSWHPKGSIVREERLGLTRALIAGFRVATAPFIATVADDNVLAPNYLEESLQIFHEHPPMGAIGGNARPRYDEPPPAWLSDCEGLLALREVGPVPRFALPPVSGYPDCAPIGAGMVLRASLARAYAEEVEISALRSSLDRAGDSLASSGDNDIVLTVMKHGGGVGTFPTLSFLHLMPPRRTEIGYLCRLQRAMMRSFVQMLAVHEMCPWPPIPPATLPLRKLRAWYRSRPWLGPIARLAWERAAGQLEGQAENWRSSQSDRRSR